MTGKMRVVPEISIMFALQVADDQFEADPTLVKLRQCPLLARLRGFAVDENDAPLFQLPHRGQHIRRAQADPDQLFVPLQAGGALGPV